MTVFSLRQVRLRSGEEYRDEVEIAVEPLELGGQRYLPVPDPVPAELSIHQASTGSVFQLAFRVPPPAVEQCHQELIASGVEILSPPKDLPSWRHRTLFFRDPEGNIIEIYAEI